MRVFVTHNPEDMQAYFGRALPQLQAIADVVLNETDHDLSTTELIAAAAACDVVIAHRSTPGERALFEQLPGLLAFFRCAVDISTIDLDAANEAGVLIARADKSFVPSTSELALGLLLDCARNISASTLDYRAGREPAQRSGWQLAGQTAGIIGCGAIGSYLAQLLQALGMHVVVADPFVDQVAPGTRHASMDDLLAESDVVFPLAPGQPSTENLIDAAAISRMKPGAVLINVSRGELIDDGAVLAALETGQLGAVGLDVGRAGDQRPTRTLAEHPHVVATPHLGGLTPQNADAQAASSVEQVAALIAAQVPPRSVNSEHASRLTQVWSP